MGYALVWQIIKTAAVKIPWAKVVQNAPLIAEMVGRARDRLRPPAGEILERPDDLESFLADQVAALEAENARLTTALKESTAKLEEIAAQLEKAQSRISVLTVVAVLSIVTALGLGIGMALK